MTQNPKGQKKKKKNQDFQNFGAKRSSNGSEFRTQISLANEAHNQKTAERFRMCSKNLGNVEPNNEIKKKGKIRSQRRWMVNIECEDDHSLFVGQSKRQNNTRAI